MLSEKSFRIRGLLMLNSVFIPFLSKFGLFKMKFSIKIYSKVLNSMVMFIFYVLDQKPPFSGKLYPNEDSLFKLKLDLQTNLNVLTFMGDVYILFFGQKILFLGKFSQNNQNCLVKIKLEIQTNSDKLNLIMIFHISDLGKFGPKKLLL